MRRVIFSVSANPIYDFWAPLTCVIWREVTTYDPFLILIDPVEKWVSTTRGKLIMDALEDIGQEKRMPSNIPKNPRILMSKLARWYACGLGVNRGDYLLTADIDIWPLQHEWFLQTQEGGAAMDFYYANAHENRKQHATCYIGGLARMWQEMVGMNLQDGILTFEGAMERAHENLRLKSYEAWRSDEVYMASQIKSWTRYPKECNFIDRKGHPPEDRIDRSSWPSHYVMAADKKWLEGKVDAHLPRAKMRIETLWTFVRPIFEAKCPAMLDWADGYIYQLGKLDR